ncbi:hypothetical protein [Methylobacterium radiodurans]|uniref:hypothetical protein n=1 Tax=Methylobacterium radiodurans TaxID=2202828 RepID=UPI0013A576CE|nr:hypothetical protein [Methylobacterium radiodurans]
MRHCATLRVRRPGAASDPRLDGIGHALEELYAPVLAEGLPEAWLSLLGRGRAPDRAGCALPGPARAGPTRPPSPGGTRS